MHLWQTREGGDCLHDDLAHLWFALSRRSTSMYLRNYRLLGVLDYHIGRGQVRHQGFQSVRRPSDNCPRRDGILFGYIYIPLCARDGTAIGEGERLCRVCRGSAEIPPAKPSALAGYVSARFDVYSAGKRSQFPLPCPFPVGMPCA